MPTLVYERWCGFDDFDLEPRSGGQRTGTFLYYLKVGPKVCRRVPVWYAKDCAVGRPSSNVYEFRPPSGKQPCLVPKGAVRPARPENESGQIMGTKRPQLVLTGEHPSISRNDDWVNLLGCCCDPCGIERARTNQVADMRDGVTIAR